MAQAPATTPTLPAYDRRAFLEYEVHRFCAEASELGIAPGAPWPQRFTVPGLGNGLPFYAYQRDERDGDLQAVRYRQAAGCVFINILND